MIKRKTWNEFRETGLFLFVNYFLHIFGWSIVISIDKEENVIEVFPARVKFRGFDQKSMDEAYQKVSKYMKDNSKALLKETTEENAKRSIL